MYANGSMLKGLYDQAVLPCQDRYGRDTWRLHRHQSGTVGNSTFLTRFIDTNNYRKIIAAILLLIFL
jgi:hypothetical protein